MSNDQEKTSDRRGKGYCRPEKKNKGGKSLTEGSIYLMLEI